MDHLLFLGGCLIRGGPPMWTSENRLKYNRDKLRYPSDLTDDEWSHIEPIIPPAKRGGRKRSVEPREIVNGLMYVLSTGCQWRYVPKDLPPKSTLFGYFDLWNWDGTLDHIHHALYVKCREATPQLLPSNHRICVGPTAPCSFGPIVALAFLKPEPSSGPRLLCVGIEWASPRT